MEEENLIIGLEMNDISKESIDKFIQLKEFANKLGFQFSDYDEIDEQFYVTFFINQGLENVNGSNF